MMDTILAETNCHILAAIEGPEDFRPLLNVSYALAKTRQGKLTIITVRQTKQRPDWLDIPPEFSDIPIEVKVLQHKTIARAILKQIRQTSADLLIVGWLSRSPRRGYLLGRNLEKKVQFRLPQQF